MGYMEESRKRKPFLPVRGFLWLPDGKIRGAEVGCMGVCVLNVPYWANPSLFCSQIVNNEQSRRK